jgi:hypothetical protein
MKSFLVSRLAAGVVAQPATVGGAQSAATACSHPVVQPPATAVSWQWWGVVLGHL